MASIFALLISAPITGSNSKFMQNGILVQPLYFILVRVCSDVPRERLLRKCHPKSLKQVHIMVVGRAANKNTQVLDGFNSDFEREDFFLKCEIY